MKIEARNAQKNVSSHRSPMSSRLNQACTALHSGWNWTVHMWMRFYLNIVVRLTQFRYDTFDKLTDSEEYPLLVS